jgi:hypothetical protein
MIESVAKSLAAIQAATKSYFRTNASHSDYNVKRYIWGFIRNKSRSGHACPEAFEFCGFVRSEQQRFW